VRVLVSIHDVSPAFEPEIEAALAAAAKVGARPALLVVPDFHGLWPLQDHARFCARLRALQGDGHEVYLHGFFHKARTGDAESAHLPAALAGSGRPGALRRAFAQRIVSGGEAEFVDLTREEAEARLARGERVLREAGLRIDGFVPPAWSMAPWGGALLAARGYRFCEDHARVYDPTSGRWRWSVVLNYASRTPARLYASVAYCRLARRAGALVPARIALHPGDMRVPLLRRELEGLLAWSAGSLVSRGAALLA
jgi:predicted deacetylase